MKSILTIIFFSQFLFGQIEAEAYINFLQSTDVKNNKHFEQIYISELKAYLAMFPDAKENKTILKALGDYYYAEDDYHDALFYYLKLRCLYSDYEVQALNEQITRIMNSEEKSDYEAVSETLFLLLPNMTSTSLMDDRFLFLEKLFELKQDEHHQLFVNEAKDYVRLYPHSINTDKVLLMIAESFERNDDHQTALFYFQLMLKLIPTSDQISHVSYKIAELLSTKLDEYRPAIDVYKELVKKDPNYVLSHAAQFNIAKLYQDELEENNDAILAFEYYLDHYPDGNYAVQSLERIAQIYEENKEYNKVIDALQRITENYLTHPNASSAQLKIIDILVDDQNRYDLAAKELVRFTELFPKHKDADEKFFEAIELVVDKLKDATKLQELGTQFLEKFPNSDYREDVQDFLNEKE
jgi:outer membrane protein assembly factor BamD (BamD/ComL family)